MATRPDTAKTARVSGSDHRDIPRDGLRVLLCFGVTQSFYDAEPADVPKIVDGIKTAFADLSGRFGVRILATMDDDELMVGASAEFPWTAYIVLDAPDLTTVTSICNIVRETEIGGYRMWKYMRIEARVGRPLFFGSE